MKQPQSPSQAQYELAAAFSRKERYRLQWLGLIIGVLSGLTAVAYRLALSWAEKIHPLLVQQLRGPVDIIIFFASLVALGLAVGLLARDEPLIKGSGIPQVEGQLLGFFSPQWLPVLSKKFIGGFLCILGGLSLGREGPSIQLGTMAAQGLTERLQLSRVDQRYLLTCGACAGLAAAFNAPLAGLMFGLEEIQKNFSSRAIFPALIASVTADVVSKLFFGTQPSLGISAVVDPLPLTCYWLYPLLGLIMGLAGVGYNKTLFSLQKAYARLPLPAWTWPVLPLLLGGVLTFYLPEILGGGHGVITGMAAGNYSFRFLLLLLAGKFIYSMLSFCSGAPGGIFFPLLVLGGLVGSCFGLTAAEYFGLPQQFVARFMLLGMCGMFSGVVRAPLTGIILVLEMSGSLTQVIGLATVAGVSWLVADWLRARPVYEQMLDNLTPGQHRERRRGDEQNIIEVTLPYKSGLAGKRVSQVTWPEQSLVVCIIRGNTRITPKGDTRMESGDLLNVVCYAGDEALVRSALDAYADPDPSLD